MVDGKHCPACGRDIGLWPVFLAGLPNRIWCPHCAARLAYRGIGGVVVALLVALAAASAGAHFASAAFADTGPNVRLAVFVGVLLGGWVLVELAAVWFLRGNRPLVLHGDWSRAGGRENAEPDVADGTMNFNCRLPDR
jgi:hypothetical protein